jgi:PPOX class probable FMN-dependent enzyme
MTGDPFDRAVTSAAELRELYEDPMPNSVRKDIGHLDAMCRRLIAAAPMVFIASASAEGHCDVTPRGGPPGFATVLDDGHLALPDATGNRRLDTLQNLVATGRAGLIFVIPGRDWTLRVNGRACVTAQPDVLERLTAVGKPPRTAIVVAAEEVYTHCPKAFMRSKLWDPESWPDNDELPSPAEVGAAHLRDPKLDVEAVEAYYAESLRTRYE